MQYNSLLRKVFGLMLCAMAVSLTAPAAAMEPGEGQVVMAFRPDLTGDPKKDFNLGVDTGETFTVYVISGALPGTVSGYQFGIEHSVAASFLLKEVRTLGEVSAFQNSIGTFTVADVAIPACTDVASGTVIAEIDFTLMAPTSNYSLRLTNWNDFQAAPDYATCAGTVVPFDDSAASLLAITPPVVPVRDVSWGYVKSRFN